MFAHLRRWMILAGVGLVGLTAACVPLATPAVPLQPAQAPAREQAGSAATVAPAADTTMAQTPEARTAVQATATPSAVAATTNARATAQSSTAVPTPTARPYTDKQLFAVKQTSIANVVQLSGTVARTGEAPLTFSIGGKVDSISVQPGQAVNAGQTIASIDTKDAVRSLRDAQSALQVDTLKVQQLQASVAAQAEAQQHQQALDTERQQAAAQAAAQAADKQVADATAKALEQLRQARANLDKVKAGASATDRLTAQASVITAQAALDKAQADLARLQAGPSQAELLTAQQQVNTAAIAVRKAEADHDKLLLPADPAALASARAAVAQAQAGVEAASNPSTPAGAPKISPAERERLQEAAQYAVTSAKAQLDALLKPPDKSAVDLANMAVDSAHNQQAIAQATLDKLKAGPTADQLSAAGSAVQAAQLVLDVAQTHAAEVNGHPTPAELADAQAAVDLATAAVDTASQPAPVDIPVITTSVAATGPQPADVAVQQAELQHALDQDRAQISSLQLQIDASQLHAPFSGILESLQVKPGDSVQAQQQIAVIAMSDDPIVTVQVPTTASGGPSVGDEVQLQGNSNSFVGVINDFSDAPNGDGKVARIKVNWNGQPPATGSTVQVSVTLQRKDQTLVVPAKALHTSGTRKSVQVLDGNRAKTVEVTVGLTSSDQVEILTGLAEGQIVILPN